MIFTEKLKQNIRSFDTVQERLNCLKNLYDNETMYLVSCGPSINKIDINILKQKLKNKLVFCVKQAYDLMPDECDVHIMNTHNWKTYTYTSDPIAVYGVALSYLEGQLDKISSEQTKCDLWIPVINPPYITDSQATSYSKNFDNFYMLGNQFETMWGKGILYELALPLAIYMGVKKIVTIGWDIVSYGNEHEHYYNAPSECTPQPGETLQLIESTSELYNWLSKNNIELQIVSDINPADQRIKRININEL
jgi:hypothetical protein